MIVPSDLKVKAAMDLIETQKEDLQLTSFSEKLYSLLSIFTKPAIPRSIFPYWISTLTGSQINHLQLQERLDQSLLELEKKKLIEVKDSNITLLKNPFPSLIYGVKSISRTKAFFSQKSSQLKTDIQKTQAQERRKEKGKEKEKEKEKENEIIIDEEEEKDLNIDDQIESQMENEMIQEKKRERERELLYVKTLFQSINQQMRSYSLKNPQSWRFMNEISPHIRSLFMIPFNFKLIAKEAIISLLLTGDFLREVHGDHEKALELYQLGIILIGNPDSMFRFFPVLIAISRTLFCQRKFDKVQDCLEKLLSIELMSSGNGPQNFFLRVSKIFHEMGMLFVNTDFLPTAKKFFSMALRFKRNYYPTQNNEDTLNTSLELTFSEPTFEKRIEHLNHFAPLTNNPQIGHLKAIIAQIFGKVYFQEKKFSEAREYFQSALQTQTDLHNHVHPATFQNLFDIGQCYFETNQYEQAKDSFEQALTVSQTLLLNEHQPSHVNLFSLLGKAQLKLYHFQKAIINFKKSNEIRKALGQNETTREFLLNLRDISSCKIQQGKYDEALQILLTMFEAYSSNSQFPNKEEVDLWKAEVCFDLGKVYSKLGQQPLSKYYFDECIKLAKLLNENGQPTARRSYGKIAEEIGWSYVQVGQFAEARQFLITRIDIEKKHGKIHDIDLADYMDHIGRNFFETGQFDEAEQHFISCLQIIASSFGITNLNLGLFYIFILYFFFRDFKLLNFNFIWIDLLVTLNHPNIGTTLGCIGQICLQRNQLKMVLLLFSTSFHLFHRFHSHSHYLIRLLIILIEHISLVSEFLVFLIFF